ncbi:MAG: F0F1 ATP synthase subunit A [Anaerorhabdus sp.]
MSDTISIFVQREVPIIIGITVVLCILSVVIGNKIKKSDPLAKPSGIVMMACWLVEMVDNMVEGTINKKYSIKLAPYIGTIAIFIFLSNIIGLFGIYSPTQNYSVTLALAIITWVLIQGVCIKENGIKAYFKGYIEPFAFLLIPNFFGRVSPLISMSLRLFGNILSGTLIMTLMYAFTDFLSGSILSIFSIDLPGLNFIGPIITPVFHAYFDVFVGFIQMFIFITLTMVFISNELPQEK